MENVCKVYFVRHGETDWNKEQRMQGHTDIPLNENGRKQADLASRFFHDKKGEIAAIFSSDLLRASETARIIGGHIGLEVVENAKLREICFGVFQTLLKTEALAKYPLEFEKYKKDREYRIPEGESGCDVFDRVTTAVETLATQYVGRSIAIVAHGGALGSMWRRLHGLPGTSMPGPSEAFANAAIAEAHYSSESWKVIRWNDKQHLKGVSLINWDTSGNDDDTQAEIEHTNTNNNNNAS
eukprot:m.35357 g.35357  ORF g.35357 m.35357 type:complete len:240 (-) comp17119_c1_seq1:25-744(-)